MCQWAISTNTRPISYIGVAVYFPLLVKLSDSPFVEGSAPHIMVFVHQFGPVGDGRGGNTVHNPYPLVNGEFLLCENAVHHAYIIVHE